MMETFNTGSEDKERKCDPFCRLNLLWLSLGVALLEVIISLSTGVYTVFGIFHYPNYDAEILIHDELYVEARKHYPGKFANVPLGLIYWDLSLVTVEFMLALYLFYGLVKDKTGKIRMWMTAMVTYNVILTGIFLGFIIGGISSSRLNLIGSLHALFRFFEIAVVYSHYEDLCQRKKLERLERDNNNTTHLDLSQIVNMTLTNYAIESENEREHAPDQVRINFSS